MTEANLFLFLAAILALIVAAGPDKFLVLARGIAQGRAGLGRWGERGGLIVHSTFAAVGLSAVLAQSATAYSAVKYVSAAYLIYLGLKALLSKDSFAVSEEAAPVVLQRIFLRNVLSNFRKKQGGSLFPGFGAAIRRAGVVVLKLLTLGLTIALLTLTIFSLLGSFSRGVGDWIRGRPGFANALRWLTGSV